MPGRPRTAFFLLALTTLPLSCGHGGSSPPRAPAPEAGPPSGDAGATQDASATDSGSSRDAGAGDAVLVTDTAPSDASVASDAPIPNDAVGIDAPADGQASEAGAADSGVAWTPKPCDFFVAASGGSDTNPGTSAKPFKSLTTLQTALRGSTGKVGCLQAGSGGSYDLAATLKLSAGVDDGETWQSDPAGGVDSAVLDGGGTLSCLIETNANGVTIDGLTLRHTINNLTCHDDGMTTISNLTIKNSDLGFNTAGAGSGGFPPCLMANGADGVTVTHNYIHDCASEGIGLFSYQTGLVLDHVLVQGNVVARAVQSVPDGGGIYLMHHNNYVASQMSVTDNFVFGYGTATVPNAHGVYLDEGTNHVTVSGNMIGPPTPGSSMAAGCLIADGHDNHFTGNICDLGPSGVAWAGVFWYPGMEGFTPGGNTYAGNLVLSHFAGHQATSDFGVMGPSFVEINSPANDPSIANNLYYNYGGGQARSDGNHTSDTNPQYEDPKCSGPIYALAAGSPAFSAPVSFSPIAGGWGPPGFAAPANPNGSCP